MHENRHLDDIMEVNEKTGITPPDRQRFENDLEEYHSTIEKLRKQIQNRCRKCLDLNPSENEMKTKRTKLREELLQLKNDGDKIKSENDSQRKKQLDLEKDCRIRDKNQLDRVLSEHEERYKRNLSARDEQALVTEINSLKRNQKQLKLLQDITAHRRKKDEELEMNRQKKRKVYFELTSLQTDFKKMKQNRREIENEIRELKNELESVYYNRKRLITTYEDNRAEYKTWLNENKLNGNSVPMSFPSARKMKAPIDEEELEPYFEQKRDCTRLIQYLERLQANTQKEEIAKPSSTATVQHVDDDDDSADELPPQLIAQHLKNTTAPVAKRNLRKATQPISHNIEIYNIFGTVDVDVPKVYAEVAEALRKVREKLEFYKLQTTNELDWGHDLFGMEFYSISRTASDMDSFMDDSISDVGSIAGFHRASSRASCPSPLATENSPKKVPEGKNTAM